MSQAVLTTFPFALNKPGLNRIFAMLMWALLLFGVASVASAQNGHDENVVVITGVNEGTVFGCGNSIRIKGTVKQGAMGLGGWTASRAAASGSLVITVASSAWSYQLYMR